MKNKKEKKAKRAGKVAADKKEKEFSDAEMGSDDEEDKELEQELKDQEEATNPEALDETIFDRFATGELDLPEVEEEDDFSDPDDVVDDDSELEAYYEELGIDADEMHDKRKKSVEDKLYKKQKKTEVKKTKTETAKRERNDVLSGMMDKARKEPNYKTLTRIIQVVKAVFTEKVDTQAKKEKDEDADMNEEEKEPTMADKHKKYAQSLQPEEYQRLVLFFSKELPSLILKMCQVKDFPSVDKLIQQSKFKNVKLGEAQFVFKNAYPGLNKKMQNLLKSFASNLNRLLAYYS